MIDGFTDSPEGRVMTEFFRAATHLVRGLTRLTEQASVLLPEITRRLEEINRGNYHRTDKTEPN